MLKLTIDVSPDGSILIEDDHGGAADITAELEKLLGTVSQKKRTCAAKSKSAKQEIRQDHG